MSLTPEQIEYMEANKDQTLQPNMYAALSLGLSLPIIAVALRLYCRRIMRLSVALDDWLIIAALIPLIGMQVTGIIAVEFGFGRHLIFVSNMVGVGQAEIAIFSCYATSVLITKMSILTFYCRLIPTRLIRVGSYILGTITVLYSSALFILTFTMCIPLAKLWTPMMDGICINTTPAFTTLAITNAVTDFAILLLPMKSVWNLHMSTIRKWQVSGVFCLGGAVCVFGTVRAVETATFSQFDPTYNNVASSIWSTVEVGIGIVCACLPSLAPLVSKSARLTSSQKYYSKGSYVMESHGTDTDHLATHSGPKTIVYHDGRDLSDREMGGIRVDRGVYHSEE